MTSPGASESVSGRGAGLYRLKAPSQRLVRPLAGWLARRDVAPDLITAAGIVPALLGGACLAVAAWHPLALLAVPFLAAGRLVANLLDGMVAREFGASRPLGEIWNEMADRLGDVLFIGGLAFCPAVDSRLALAAAVMPLLASYVGLAAKAAGGRRGYGGIMSKPGRMGVLAVAAPLAWASGDLRWLAAAAAVIAGGGLVTLGQRWLAAVSELGR
jgi:CDP-diacylglycerol--glycerol-3-phosphate 3-phosphatidyltransferase